ncbi:MAG: MBL fold metallo-hydrolase [Bacteroidota bacterium]
MKIKFCGAARTVTGSSHLISLEGGTKILLDCGLYQGHADEFENFNENWHFKPWEIDYLILSHAHIDHSGRVPKLCKDGFKGQIICTYATRDLCTIMLLDSAHIQEKDAEYKNKIARRRKSNKKYEPLYVRKDVENCLNQFVGVGYGIWHELPDGNQVLFRDAGHILGSASVSLRLEENEKKIKVGFTGDIGRPERPILKNPEPMPHADVIICESTYGGKEHEAPPKQHETFLEIVEDACVRKKGKLIIPAFSVGRTQEIVYMMDQLAHKGDLPEIPIFVDSPLAINATDIFKTHPECYDREILEYMLEDPDPFGFNKLHYIRSVEGSKRLNDYKDPCVIISASGMITAGRIVHHINNSIENPRNTVLIVGYCAEGTIGAQLARGADTIKIFGNEKKVKAEIKRMHSFSGHGDQQEMIDFLSNQDKEKVEKIFLVHGNYDRQKVFADALKKEGFSEVLIPDLAEEFEC